MRFFFAQNAVDVEDKNKENAVDVEEKNRENARDTPRAGGGKRVSKKEISNSFFPNGYVIL